MKTRLTRTAALTVAVGSLAFVAGPARTANAAVIPGPALTNGGGVCSVTGLSFLANTDTTMTSFTYQNLGKADTIVLTDASGNILDSIATPASTPSDVVTVNWALSSGSEYYLLQTVVEPSPLTLAR